MDRIRLVDLEDEEGPELVLPSGAVARVRYFDAIHTQMYVEAMRTGAMEGEDAMRLLRYALPVVDDAELATLSAKMIWFIGQAANRRADLMMTVLRKNGSGLATPPSAPAPAAETSTPPRSPRRTKSKTSAPASGDSRAANG